MDAEFSAEEPDNSDYGDNFNAQTATMTTTKTRNLKTPTMTAFTATAENLAGQAHSLQEAPRVRHAGQRAKRAQKALRAEPADIHAVKTTARAQA